MAGRRTAHCARAGISCAAARPRGTRSPCRSSSSSAQLSKRFEQFLRGHARVSVKRAVARLSPYQRADNVLAARRISITLAPAARGRMARESRSQRL